MDKSNNSYILIFFYLKFAPFTCFSTLHAQKLIKIESAPDDFLHLGNLTLTRYLDNNKIRGDNVSLGNVNIKLKNLSLDGNNFEEVPREMLMAMPSLRAL
jgi:Leucine-rich repeat (LRR) protein